MNPERLAVVVVGAGPAGIAAAVRACEAGAEVTVVDENPHIGGQIWKGSRLDGRQPTAWFRRFDRCDIALHMGARVVAAEAQTRTLHIERDRDAIALRFDKLILATGARERFLPFPGWTLPGVIGAGAIQLLMKTGLPIRRKRIVLAGTGPLLLAVAASLRRAGADLLFVAEQARRSAAIRFGLQFAQHRSKLRQAAALQWELAGVPYLTGCYPIRAEGDDRLRRIDFRRGRKELSAEVDYAAIGWGLVPNIELAQAVGCKTSGGVVVVDHLQQTSMPGVFCAGEGTGIGGVDLSVVEGEIAGFSAAGDFASAEALDGRKRAAQDFATLVEKTFALRDELKNLPEDETIVCRCEDVRYGQIRSFHSAREARLHARFGMGPCQGRVCGPSAEFLLGWKANAERRPPVFPARIGTLAEYP